MANRRAYAVIDVGTNSVKFHLGERDRGGTWRTVVDRAEMTRLGEGLEQHRVIGDAALERTAAAIAGMVDEAKRHGVLATVAVGTAGLRIASNRDAVVAAIEARTGVRIEVISGDEEGRLAYVAATSGLGLSAGSLVVFDTGGGSSQFTFGHGSSVDERFSVNVGAVRYTERYKLDGVVSAEVLREAMAAIAADLSRLDGRPVPAALVAMGGAVTNITAVKHGLARYDPAIVQGTVLDRAEIDRQIELYRSRDADAAVPSSVSSRSGRKSSWPARASSGRSWRSWASRRLTVSDRGLRHGVLTERFGAMNTERAMQTRKSVKASKYSASRQGHEIAGRPGRSTPARSDGRIVERAGDEGAQAPQRGEQRRIEVRRAGDGPSRNDRGSDWTRSKRSRGRLSSSILPAWT